MNKKRWLLAILLVIIVLPTLIGLFVYYRIYRQPPLRMQLSQHPDYVTSPTVILSGTVSREAQIEVTRGTSSLGTVFAKKRFDFQAQLEPGQNEIRFLARTDENDDVAETTVSITWEPKNPPVPVINSLPAITNLPEVTITGTTYPNGKVRITVSSDVPELAKNTQPQGPKQPNSEKPIESPSSISPLPNAQKVRPVMAGENASKDGAFQTKVRLAEPGPYKVSSVAYNSVGASSAPSSDLRFVYDPDWYPPTNPVGVETSKVISRKANIVLTHKQMSITLEATLPQFDPAVTSLLANQTNPDDFFNKIFGLRINRTYYSGEFRDTRPQIVIKEHNATITATTRSDRTTRDYLPVLDGELVLDGKGNFPFSNPEDSLTIRTYDYTIESVGPPPTFFEKNTLTWAGNKTQLPNNEFDRREIKVQLAYQPFASPRNLFRLAQVSPYSFWRYPGSTIPHLLYGLYSLVPMLWVLWLIGESRVGSIIDEGLRRDLSRLSTTLITLSLIDTVFNVSWGLAYLAYHLHILRRGSSSNPFLLASASFAIFLLAFLCWLLARPFTARTWGIWFTRIGVGTLKAALICLLIIPTRVLEDLPFLVHAIKFIVIFPVIVVTLYVFFSRTDQVLKHESLTTKHRRLLTLLIAVVSLEFLVPIVIPSTSPAYSIITQFFSILQDLLPFALAIGLLIILKKAITPDRRNLVLCVGLMLFSVYLVGINSTLFMIPIPFILSIWIFKKFIIHDFSKWVDLDNVNNEVVTDRRRLIEGVLAYETAQQFQADVQKLKEKVSSGDMTPKDFEDRKLEIENYAREKELASTHVNGLHAKTTVLGIGPTIDDWSNGKWCFKWGAALIAPFLAAYLLLLLVSSTAFSETAFRLQFAFNQVLTFVADWLIAAFFFGYYFRYLRGDTGLEKGLRIACGVIVCFLPTWITSISDKTDLLGVFFRAGQTFLFFTLLGIAALDYKTFRAAFRDQFRWKTFARFGNMPSLTALLSVLVTSIGVTLTTVVTGQFKDLLTSLISAAFQTPGAPPQP